MLPKPLDDDTLQHPKIPVSICYLGKCHFWIFLVGIISITTTFCDLLNSRFGSSSLRDERPQCSDHRRVTLVCFVDGPHGRSTPILDWPNDPGKTKKNARSPLIPGRMAICGLHFSLSYIIIFHHVPHLLYCS